MPHSYSLDLRVRVVSFVEARYFGVSDSFAIKLMQRQRRSGSPPRPAKAGPSARASWHLTRRSWFRSWSLSPTSPCRT